MNINELITHILSDVEGEVLCISLTGSETFCSNCKDTDIWVIANTDKDYSRIFGYEGYDIFVWSLNNLKECTQFEQKEFKSLYIISFLKNEKLYGTNPIPDFNLLDHKNKLVDLMIMLCERKYNNSLYANAKNDEMCLKQSVWLFANYFAILNDSLDFTDEQKEILQKCHDNELPRSYIEDLYNNLLTMKQGE